MKRPFVPTNNDSDDAFADTPADTDVNRASYADNDNNNNQSDSDCLSETSRRLRKKRNAYQKISDDIRVKLLEAVQNGETLKAAAKRHRINYSSAKSILHTYRKEGRILKKSAQERTTKKKPHNGSEKSGSTKTSKTIKKESVELDENNYKVNKKVKTETYCVNSEEVQPLGQVTKSRANIQRNTTEEKEDNGKSQNALAVPVIKNEELQNKLFGTDTSMQEATNFIGALSSRVSSRKGSMRQFGLFDGNHNHNHYNDMHHMPDFSFNFTDGQEFLSFRRFSNDFASFGDLVNAFQSKAGQSIEDGHHDGVKHHNSSEDMSKMHGEVKNLLDYDDQGEAGSYPLKSFMETQRMFKNALRKASFLSMGSNAGFRKGSFDFM